jgi:hypothetical protein
LLRGRFRKIAPHLGMRLPKLVGANPLPAIRANAQASTPPPTLAALEKLHLSINYAAIDAGEREVGYAVLDTSPKRENRNRSRS